MAYRTYYKSESSLPVTFTWKCSCCGHINKATTELHTSTTYLNKHTSMSLTESQMYYNARVLFTREGSFEDYRELGLFYRCKKCNNIEPWAVLKLGWFRKVFFVCVIIGIVLFLVNSAVILFSSGVPEDILGSFIIAVLLGSLLALGYYIDKSYVKRKNLKLKNLPTSALPILLIDGVPVADIDTSISEIKRLMVYCSHCGFIGSVEASDYESVCPNCNCSLTITEIDPNSWHALSKDERRLIKSTWNLPSKVVNTSSKGSITATPFYCRKCGKSIPTDSMYCPYCGEKT